MSYFDEGFNDNLIRTGSDPTGGLEMSDLVREANYPALSTPTQVSVSVPAKSLPMDKLIINKIGINDYISSNGFVSGSTGWRIHGNGDGEFNNVVVRGEITATTGKIGDWVIDSDGIYYDGSGTPYIKTAETVGAGTTGVIIDKDGLRGYDSVLGNTFDLPADGSAPTFSSGIINETIYEISTNAVLRTSSTVGDGSASSAGVLINNTGFYATEASQTLANANVKILTDGSASFKGAVTADTGYIGGTTGWVITSNYIKDVAGATGLSSVVTGGDDIRIWAGHATPASAPFTVTEAGALTATSATITGAITISSGSGIANLSDAGDLVTIDEADIDVLETTNAPVDASATAGADWDTSLTSIPGTLATPSGAGLYLSSTYLGYYNSSAWKTYMDNVGNFYLGGSSGSLQWTSATDTLTVTGEVNATSGTFEGITAATIDVGASGYMLGGQTAFNTGSGFFLGSSGGEYKLSLGDPDGEYLTWDGDNLRLKGNIELSGILTLVNYDLADLPSPIATEGFNSPSSNE